MIATQGIGLEDVKAVYGGPEGDLWELVMGHQVHIGGLKSSAALAEKAGIGHGMNGVDLCCCNGAGMRFLVRMNGVASMCGVDATSRVIERGRARTDDEGLSDKVRLLLADVCETGLPESSFDFAWGEDAWCYVEDKKALIDEAVRLVKPGGTIAFTDWLAGSNPLSAAEADRYLRFMKFPNVQDIAGYTALLRQSDCDVLVAEDTGQFAPHVDLYLQMLDMQLTYDALRTIGFDTDLMASLAGEMQFMQGLAHDGKIIQGRFVARKR